MYCLSTSIHQYQGTIYIYIHFQLDKPIEVFWHPKENKPCRTKMFPCTEHAFIDRFIGYVLVAYSCNLSPPRMLYWQSEHRIRWLKVLACIWEDAGCELWNTLLKCGVLIRKDHASQWYISLHSLNIKSILSGQRAESIVERKVGRQPYRHREGMFQNNNSSCLWTTVPSIKQNQIRS